MPLYPPSTYLPLAGGTLTGDLMLSTGGMYDVSEQQFMLGTQTNWPNANVSFYNNLWSVFNSYVYFNDYVQMNGNLDYNGLYLYLPNGYLIFGSGATSTISWQSDNLCDIGAVSSTRPRSGYAGTKWEAPLLNATTGFQVAGAATSGNYLRADGTNFISAGLSSQDATGLSWSNRIQTIAVTVPANYSAYVSGSYEVAAGIVAEVGAGSIVEVG